MGFSENIVRLLEERYNKQVDWASEYGEPGYSKEKDAPILFSDWNGLPSHIMEGIERRFNIEWCDEWVINHETSKAYRCSGDSYEWKPYFLMTDDGDIIGGDEIEEDFDQQAEYIKNYLLNNPERVCVFDFDLSEHGFVKCNENDYENGWHPGQTDNPHKILEEAQKKWPDHDFVFGELHTSQFYITFSLYRRPVDYDEEYDGE